MDKRKDFKEGGSKMLVVFEGLDNCGKTTIVEKLKNYYDQQGIPAEFTREFETDVGKLIKKMSQENQLDSILKSYLFAADRQIRTRMYTDEDYQDKMILFDRYYHSAIAYRMAEGINKEWVMTLNSVFKKPDIGFYIDITPEESVKRNTDTKFNIIASAEHLSKVRNAYLSFIHEENLIYIDGMRDLESIYNEVLNYIETYRKGKIDKKF